jgi:ADP-heptose:LPS heptosyltransferase
LAFQTTLQTIPAPSRYIQSDPDKVAQWQNKLGEKTKPRIGIVWSGSMAYNVVERSIALSEFLKLLSGDCQFISLQKEIRESDKATLQANPQILFLGDELTDFSDTAALCDLMDAVISIDTSVAHLACAMGKPVSILLAYVPDWRWLLDKTDNPWYPTARLYRQDAPDNWDGVIQRYKLPADLFGL